MRLTTGINSITKANKTVSKEMRGKVEERINKFRKCLNEILKQVRALQLDGETEVGCMRECDRK